MKILVACEFSGRVRDSFISVGHQAVSCDIIPSELPGPHIQDDVRKHLADGWDMMIAFPPCTHLASSGARWFRDKRELSAEAGQFVVDLWNAPIEKVCIENPIGLLSTYFHKPSQYIQPYNFLEDASKKTCLWLRNLPLLIGTGYVEPRIVNGKKRWSNQTDSGQNKLPPSATRAKERGKTYWGIAIAMATQWG